MEKLCPACGECEMEEFHMGIYECRECGNMIDGEVLKEIYESQE